jgi:hypothetical protein
MRDALRMSRVRRFQLPPPVRFEHTLPGVGERRHLPREPFRAEVQVLPLDGRQPAIGTSSEDISRRGMFMATAVQYPLGTVLRLELSTEHGELALMGRVVHRLDGIGVGCEFIDLEERERAQLDFLVGLHQPQQPGRLH